MKLKYIFLFVKRSTTWLVGLFRTSPSTKRCAASLTMLKGTNTTYKVVAEAVLKWLLATEAHGNKHAMTHCYCAGRCGCDDRVATSEQYEGSRDKCSDVNLLTAFIKDCSNVNSCTLTLSCAMFSLTFKFHSAPHITHASVVKCSIFSLSTIHQRLSLRCFIELIRLPLGAGERKQQLISSHLFPFSYAMHL